MLIFHENNCPCMQMHYSDCMSLYLMTFEAVKVQGRQFYHWFWLLFLFNIYRYIIFIFHCWTRKPKERKSHLFPIPLFNSQIKKCFTSKQRNKSTFFLWPARAFFSWPTEENVENKILIFRSGFDLLVILSFFLLKF